MSAKTQLSQLAIEIANDILQSAQALKPELQKVKLRAAQIEAQLHAANLCHERLSRFQPEIDGKLQCPCCWVRNETQRPLTAVGGGDHQNDFFRCPACEQEVVIVVR